MIKKRKDNKKGVSTIVAAVLLILLTISAVVLLLSFIKPFVENNLKRSTECLPYKEYFQFEERFVNNSGSYNYNCYKSPVSPDTNYLTGIMVKAGTNLSGEEMKNLKGFVLVFKKDSASESIQVTDGRTVSSSSGGIRILGDPATVTAITINKPGEMITYVYDSSNQYKDVEIYPLLKSDRICDEKSDSIKIKVCSDPGVTLS